MNDITTGLIIADRAHRGLSRAKYAELVGVTPTKVFNLEKGRKPEPHEEDMLRAVIYGEGGIGRHQITASVEPLPEGETPVVLMDEYDDDIEDEFISVGEPGQLQFSLSDAPAVIKPPILTPPLPPAPRGKKADAEEPTPTPTPTPEPVPMNIITKYEFKLPGYHISNSELKTFKRCHRKWWLAYYRELRLKRPEVTGPRPLGTRMHLALSSLYSENPQDPMLVLKETYEVDRKRLSEGTDIEALDNLNKEEELAVIMMEGYIQWLEETGIDEGITVIGNEEVVEVPFMEGVVLIGKMDLRIQRVIDGARLFLDHKTVADLTTPMKTLHMDEQMLQYHLLEYLKMLSDGVEENEAHLAAGGLYNMLRKVKRTATAKPPFYERVEVRHNIHELRSYYIRVFGEVVDIMNLKKSLDEGADHRRVAYPNPTRDCSWDCDFIAVCPMFDDGSAAEELLENYYEKSDPHNHYYATSDTEEKSGQ